MPVEIRWSSLALGRLREIRERVAGDKPEAAERLAGRIVAVVEALRIDPRLGRAGPEPGIREIILGGTPYIVIYRIHGKRVVILLIRHAARQPQRDR